MRFLVLVVGIVLLALPGCGWNDCYLSALGSDRVRSCLRHRPELIALKRALSEVVIILGPSSGGIQSPDCAESWPIFVLIVVGDPGGKRERVGYIVDTGW